MMADFERQGKVTQALMRLSMEASASPTGQRGYLAIEIVKILQYRTGYVLTEGYVARALQLYRTTGLFVEDSQAEQSSWYH